MSFKKYILPLILILCLVFSVYCFATAWDVSTASYDSKYKDVGSEDGIPVSVAFKSDGSKMYIVGSSSDRVYQYSLPVEVELNNSIFFGCNF